MNRRIELEDFIKLKEILEGGFDFNYSQIAKMFNISDKTAKKYMKMDTEEFKKYQKDRDLKLRESRLDPYKTKIIGYYDMFPMITAAQIYDKLLEENNNFLPFEYGTVKLYFRQLKKEKLLKESLESPKQRQYQAVPELDYGAQAQVDLGEIIVKTVSGEKIKLYTCCMVLSRSRYKFGTWLDRPYKLNDFILFHLKCFSHFGGVPKEIVYDRTRLALIDEPEEEFYNKPEEFEKLSVQYKFKVKFCKPNDPESKGKIENVIQYVKGNFASARVYETLEKWTQSFEKWLIRTGNGKIHQTINKVPAEEFALEKLHLQPTPINNTNSIPYVLKKDNTVRYCGNRFAVPKGTYREGIQVLITVVQDSLTITTMDGELLASHVIPDTKGNLIYGEIERKEKSTITELKLNTLNILGNTIEAANWLEQLIILKPKNQRKYFNRIIQEFEKINKDTLQQALKYCIENKKWLPDDVLSFEEHLTEAMNRDSVEIKVPSKVSKDVTVPVRDISIYDQVCRRNK